MGVGKPYLICMVCSIRRSTASVVQASICVDKLAGGSRMELPASADQLWCACLAAAILWGVGRGHTLATAAVSATAPVARVCCSFCWHIMYHHLGQPRAGPLAAMCCGAFLNR
jgi:hypothetical protein